MTLILSLLLATTIVFEVPGLTCPTCVPPVKKALALVDGVQGIQIDWRARRIELTVDSEKVTEAQLRAILSESGFAATDEDTPKKADRTADYLELKERPESPAKLAVWGKATVVAVCTPACVPCDAVKKDLTMFAQRANRVAVRVVTIPSDETAPPSFLPKGASFPYLWVYDTQTKRVFAGQSGKENEMYRAVEAALGVTH